MKTSPSNSLRALAQLVLLLAFYTAVTCLVFWPLLPHLGAVLIGPPEDNLQDFWNSWYVTIGAGPRHFFETHLVRYPEGVSLNYHSFSYVAIAAVKVLAGIFGDSHATLLQIHNIVLLASFPIAATGAFFLVRRFITPSALRTPEGVLRAPPPPARFARAGEAGQNLAALVGGYVFAFNPAHVAQLMHHMHVSEIGFLPFFVLAWLKAVDDRKPAWLAAAIIFFVLNALSCWYYLFYQLYFMTFHGVWRVLRDKRRPTGWEVFTFTACLAGSAALLSPLLVPMVAQSGAPGAYVGGSDIFTADILGFFVFSPTHLLGSWTQAFYAIASGNPWEATIYLGLVNLALLVWLVRRTRKPGAGGAPTAYILWGIAVFAVLAAGDTLHLLGQSLFIPLPNTVLSRLPFFANARTPSRAIVFVYLFLSIGVGYALALAMREWRGRWARPALAAITILIALDFFPTHLETTPADCPPELSVISQDADRQFGVLNLPLGTVEFDTAMFQQTCHGRPVVGASISRTLHETLMDRLAMTDRVALRRQLVDAHTKYIVVDNRLPWTEIARVKLRVMVSDRFPYVGFVRSSNAVRFIASDHFPWVKGVLRPPAPPIIPEAQFLSDYHVVTQSPDMTVLRVY